MDTVLFVVGGLCWTLAYVDAIRIGVRERTYAIPAVCIVLNFTWEVLYTAHYVMVSVNVKSLVDVSWVILDAVILYTLVRYGGKELGWVVAPRRFPLLCLAMIAFGFVLQGAFVAEFGWSQAARVSSFPMTLLMSTLFLLMYVSRGGPRGQSLLIAVAKGIGTICFTCHFGVLEGSPLVMAIGAMCAVLDTVYVVLLVKSAGVRKARPDHSGELVGG